jgi:transcriptional regulator with XRE-family HTH domain
MQQLREAAGISQAALSKATGIPLGTIRNWEQNRRMPALDKAGRVARALRISLDDLWVDEAEDLAPEPKKKASRSAKK